ncbi:hypothetical protein DFP73DRAFT_593923 [Morchella snyderi]|nr:hypothetical protein DFP73DRAFT_593923 [Morchella snyderi]
MPPEDTITTITPKETLTTSLAVLAILFIVLPLFILPVTLLLLLLFVQPFVVYLLADKVKDIAFPPRLLGLFLLLGRITKPSNETTRLLQATRIQARWKGKARAKDLEAQTPIVDQLDGQSSSGQKEDKAAAAKARKVPPASSESGPSEVLPREGPIRHHQNPTVDDWPTSCGMVVAVLTVGAMTLLLIVFFGNLEIKRPKS